MGARRRQTFAAAALALVLAASAAAGCDKNARPATPASACRDACAATTCPVGSSCTISDGCTPRCQQEYIPPR